MDIQTLRDALRSHPFRPFTMYMVDGRSLAVSRPELVAVGRQSIICIANDDSWSLVEPSLIVSLQFSGDTGKGNSKARRKPRQ